MKAQLFSDHQRLEVLFEALLSAFAANAREDTQSLWTKLQAGLEAHFSAEERFLFPGFARVDPIETAALLAEHDVLRKQLDELGTGVDLKLVRENVAKGFIETLRRHARREDALLYPWAEARATPATRRRMMASVGRAHPA